MEACYLRHSKIPLEEDLTHEFKGHRDLSKLDLNDNKYKLCGGTWWRKETRFRSPLSKSICAMLNTGLKSTLYLGVTDAGIVEGFMMSLYQRDHFQLSLRDLLSKFNPPCPDHVIKITFVPILDEDEDGIVLPEPIGLDTQRSLEHTIHGHAYCWCDCLTLSAFGNGVLHRFYVIELSINKWDQNDPRNTGLINQDVCDQRPIFANEFGKIYIRRNGYVRKIMSGEDLANLKKYSYINDTQNLQDLGLLPQNNSDSEDEDTEYFSYDSN